jgi:hypothetical protein
VSESQGVVPEIAPAGRTVATTLPLPAKALPKGRPSPPVKSWEVCVDDFIGMVQGSWTHRRHVKWVLLQNLDKVFRPLDHLDNEHRQDPASIKKMKKWDASWATRKVVLGRIVNTVRLTIDLPAQRLTRLFDLLHSIPPQQRRVSTKKWQQLVGELRSTVLAIPGGKCLFSILQHVLKVRSEGGTRLRLTTEVHTILKDFGDLASDLGERPTRIAELIPSVIPATAHLIATCSGRLPPPVIGHITR